ncbi:MAG TPA: ADP-ribosylglycohydrolase family protein, partial [Burkholderiales bacterium]|nr:ADP-ribosylglycohydrolase family protein [Burkholderiales bacterium]
MTQRRVPSSARPGLRAAAGLLLTAACLSAAVAAGKVRLNEADFRDRVHACWLGKTIGGTLGMPFEGKREPNDVSYYTALKPGEPAANDDLDLQILWLKAMEEN